MSEPLPDNIWDVIDNQIGWCWRNKADAIYRIGQDPFVQKAVEIGVFGGRSLIPLCASAIPRGAKVHGFDIYKPHKLTTEEETKYWDKTYNLEDIYNSAISAIAGLGFGYEIIKKSSSIEASKLFKEDSIQYVHIDGSHFEWDSCEDVILWSQRLVSGGYLLIDDVDRKSLQPAVALLGYGPFVHIDTFYRVDPKTSGHAQLWKKR